MANEHDCDLVATYDKGLTVGAIVYDLATQSDMPSEAVAGFVSHFTHILMLAFPNDAPTDCALAAQQILTRYRERDEEAQAIVAAMHNGEAMN
jgi:hypothetical protein